MSFKAYRSVRVGVLAPTCLLLLGCMAIAPAALAQTRHALLVGIDDYDVVHASSCPETPSGRPPCRCDWRDLAGSVNDAKAMQELLIAKYGFRPQEMKVLTDREATRERILAAIRSQLVAPAHPGDEVLLCYAGHGSQIKNSLSDEPDQLDETIVPADARRDAARQASRSPSPSARTPISCSPLRQSPILGYSSIQAFAGEAPKARRRWKSCCLNAARPGAERNPFSW